MQINLNIKLRKKMKNLIYKTLSIVILGLGLTSCDQDDSVPDIPRANSSTAIIVEESITINEGNPFSFTIVQENLVEEKFDDLEFGESVSGQLGIRVIGGSATQGDDFTFNIPTIQEVTPFLLQGGYYYGYDASVSLEHIVNDIITIIDDGKAEGTETIELQFFPVGISGVIFNDILIVEITD